MLYDAIRDVKGKGWCGPTAISSITQTPISKIHKMVRRVRADRERERFGRVLIGGSAKGVDGRRMPVMGMYNSEILEVMKRLKFKVLKQENNYKGTLKSFIDDCGHLGPFIVNVTGHYIAVSHGMICDTYTDGKPIKATEYQALRKQVKVYFQFA